MAENDLEEDSLISQDDIDKLMESPPAEEKEEQEDTVEEEEDQEDFAQEDIDALLDGMDFDSEESGGGEDEDEDEEDLNLISQEDINRLMNADADEPEESSDREQGEEEPEPETEAKETAAPPVQEDETPNDVESEGAEDDWVIGESESVDIQESLMAQATLDELLAGREEPEPVEEEPPEDLEEEAADLEPEPEPEAEAAQQRESGAEEEESDVTVVDLEDDELEDTLPEEQEEADTDQEDIDALLTDTEEDESEQEEWEGDDLISQQDIEDLIMESGGDEEDIGEDILSATDSSSDEDEDTDFEEESDIGGEEDESESDKIVLEATEPDETKAAETEDTQARDETARKKWYKSRVFMLAASIVIVAGITISAGLFFLLPGETPKSPAPSQEQVVRKEAPPEESGVDTVDINLEKKESVARNEAAPAPEPAPAAVRETIVMEDFVILAPESAEGLVYIQADLSIDYSGEQAYNNTRNNMPYFRDLVYSSIRGAFESGKGDEVTESELLAVVEKALKRELPSSQIRGISFKAFKAG